MQHSLLFKDVHEVLVMIEYTLHAQHTKIEGVQLITSQATSRRKTFLHQVLMRGYISISSQNQEGQTNLIKSIVLWRLNWDHFVF